MAPFRFLSRESDDGATVAVAELNLFKNERSTCGTTDLFWAPSQRVINGLPAPGYLC
jgi:hypothetical protein